MKEIFYTDIKDKKEFGFDGTRLVQVDYNPHTGRYLYKRFYGKDYGVEGKLMGYEVVKPKKVKNPDGTEVQVYPGTNDFGHYGWYLPRTSTQNEIDYWMWDLKSDKVDVGDFRKMDEHHQTQLLWTKKRKLMMEKVLEKNT